MRKVEVPDHDDLMLQIQSVVVDAIHLVPRDFAEGYLKRHSVSRDLLYSIARWHPDTGKTFLLRKLLDAYECAQDMLNGYRRPGT